VEVGVTGTVELYESVPETPRQVQFGARTSTTAPGAVPFAVMESSMPWSSAASPAGGGPVAGDAGATATGPVVQPAASRATRNPVRTS